MKEVSVLKDELLKIVCKNREDHRRVFEEASEGYRKAAIAELDASLADARAGKRIRRSIPLVEPMDMTQEYDRVIQMLEMHQHETITITDEEFRNFVQDRWHWTPQWATSNASYANSMTKPIKDVLRKAGWEDYKL